MLSEAHVLRGTGETDRMDVASEVVEAGGGAGDGQKVVQGRHSSCV